MLAGLLEVVPNFGPVIATIPAVIIALLRGSSYLPISNFWFAVLVVGLYILIQQVENNYLVPRIMSRRLQLHPVVVFIGMLGGATLAGVVGLLLAAPTLATVRVLLRYTYAKLLDEDPFPIEVQVTRELYPGEIDAVLFDLDGTLIDTDDTAMGTLARLLQPLKWALPKHDPAYAARRLLMALETPGNRLLALLDRLGLDERLYWLAERLRSVRGLYVAASFRPVDGVFEMVDDLSRRYRIGIVTTRARCDAQSFLDQQALADRMAVVIAREDTRRQKPHPAPILLAAQRLAVLPERCLVVGDTTVDVQAACAAGAWSVGVLCGFGERGELERAGADVILETTADLVGVL
jgi:phosphoglycolate phosphatase